MKFMTLDDFETSVHTFVVNGTSQKVSDGTTEWGDDEIL